MNNLGIAIGSLLMVAVSGVTLFVWRFVYGLVDMQTASSPPGATGRGVTLSESALSFLIAGVISLVLGGMLLKVSR